MRLVADHRRMRPSQVAKCVPKKYGGSGDPYAHVSLFKQVLRAEQITNFHTQYEGFGLTLEGTALTWFQPMNIGGFYDIDHLLREFAEEFSKRGIKHNTVSQIYAFKQREHEKVKEASLRFKQYIGRCPVRERPQDDRLSVLFIEGLRNVTLKKDLHLKACTSFEQVTREALYLVDNCTVYGEVSADTNFASSSSSSVASEITTKKNVQTTTMPNVEQMIEDALKRMAPYQKPLPKTLKWCAIEQKWTNHPTEECYYNKGYVRERQYAPPAQLAPPQVHPVPRYPTGNVPGPMGIERPQPVLGQQPPLPGARPVGIRYAPILENQ
ncbi:hypothetical protein DD606_25735 [Enterobacter cloacae complex sp. GF14B]|nr:hypothetical protein DD606_25735 [Enterobacter cloacae complex sp. GF14B]